MTIYDAFEDGDISEYSGDTGNFSVQQGTVLEGDDALEATDSNNTVLNITSTSGLNAYPSSGDTWKAFFYLDDSNTNLFRVLFGGDGTRNNGYESSLEVRSGNLRLLKRSGGGTETDATNSVSFSTGIWYRMEIDWNASGNNDITVRLYEDSNDNQVGSVSINDSDYTGGVLGWTYRADSGTTGVAYADFAATQSESIATKDTAVDTQFTFTPQTSTEAITVADTAQNTQFTYSPRTATEKIDLSGFYNVENRAETELALSVASGDESIEVNDASQLPSPPFLASIEGNNQREIIEVNEVNGNTLDSVFRGREDTSAQSWSSGVTIANRWTKGTYDQLVNEIKNNQN